MRLAIIRTFVKNRLSSGKLTVDEIILIYSNAVGELLFLIILLLKIRAYVYKLF